MLTTFNEIDMSAAMALRERWREAFEKKHGVQARLHVDLRQGGDRRAEGTAGGQRRDRRRRHRLQEPLRHRRRGRHRAGPRRAGGARRRLRELCRDREGDRRARPQGARRQADDRGSVGRHLHDLERRRLRLAVIDADPQPAAIGDPRHAQDRAPPGRGRRQDRDPPNDVCRADLRSPHHRRPRGGDVSRAHQGMRRGPLAPPVRICTLMPERYDIVVSAPGRADMSRRSAPRSSGCARPASTRAPRSAAPASISAASRPRRCCNHRRNSPRRGMLWPSTGSGSARSGSISPR